MKIEEQVTSLELSEKRKELGVKQKSLFSWFYDEEDKDNQGIAFDIQYSDASTYQDDKRICSAFTVAELGELLPDYIQIDATNWTLTIEKDFSRLWDVRYGWEVTISGKADTEANVRAKMLIYLLENGLIETHAKRKSLRE